MKQKGSLGLYALSVILLLAVVVLSARFCAVKARNYVREQADSAHLWILQEQTITRGFGLQLLDNQVRYAASFGVGLTDAMIQFENIPYDPTGAFISLWKGMNPGILVRKVEFLNHAVRVTMACESYAALEQYRAALVGEKYFSLVLCGDPVEEDQRVVVVLTCFFA